MVTIKIMPCLDMKEGRVVKGVNFVGLKDAGDPVENAAVLSTGRARMNWPCWILPPPWKTGRPGWSGLRMLSAVISIPLTVGGGISSLEDIELVLKAGATKVSMNSAAVKNPALVKDAVKQFGSGRITMAVDGRRNTAMPSGFELVVSGGTKPVGKDTVQWAKECQDLGAGAILPTSMDADGTKDGYDLAVYQGHCGCGQCTGDCFRWGGHAGTFL